VAEQNPGIARFRWGFAVASYVALVIGMAAHVGYHHVTGQSEWTGNSFWAAFFVSPMVFGAFLHIVKSEIDFLTGGIIAFQNGFFWKEIFSGLSPILQGSGAG
jgi:hypothetical protein